MVEFFKVRKQEQGYVGWVVLISIYISACIKSLSAKLHFISTSLNGALKTAPYGTQYET